MARARAIMAVIVALAAAVPAVAADPDNGADLFDTHCSDCHSLSPKGVNRKGPTLFRALGRRAGSVSGFRYSADMQKAGFLWTPARLDAYLANPKAVIPGGIMKFKGLPRPADRADLIAYLSQ